MKIDTVFALSPVPFPEIAGRIFQSDRGSATTERIVTGAPEYRVGPVSIQQIAHVIYLISPAQ